MTLYKPRHLLTEPHCCRLRPLMNNCRYITKYVTPEYWTTEGNHYNIKTLHSKCFTNYINSCAGDLIKKFQIIHPFGLFFRKFIEAAQRYNELSYRNIIHEDERMTCLRNALICTVLASAGKTSFIMGDCNVGMYERRRALKAYNIHALNHTSVSSEPIWHIHTYILSK